MSFFETVADIHSVEEAQNQLFSYIYETETLQQAVAFAMQAHEGQTRKSGEPYITHPILVATITAYYGGDETMVIAALLHDVVEDTPVTLEEIYGAFGEGVGWLVDGLTKIDHIRHEKLIPSTSDEKLISSALTFRKILIASINDIRILVIKLCDRMHNMMTLNALPPNKQRRIAEETLVVYAPIAHRLGISSIKNELEDRSFFYIFPSEYQQIIHYFQTNQQEIQLRLNNFISKVSDLLLKSGFTEGQFEIKSRIKRHYSIYLKMQRKGISIEEVLDLLAIRILVLEPVDCYKVLGIVHLHFKPIISRFKDYIAIPKENGYQTIHTTVFENTHIYEVQIRTKDMHKSAEYGVAAHWKYKTGGLNPSLDWLSNLRFQGGGNIEEFYELAKNDLYSDDISVFSPDGDIYTLPNGAVALDFAYAVHTEIGNHAKEAYINKQKASLLSVLKNGDIIRIATTERAIPRCSWIDAVKTSRAKNQIHLHCQHKIKDLDKQVSLNILATIFDKPRQEIDTWIDSVHLETSIHKAAKDSNYLREIKNRLKNSYRTQASILHKIKIKILKLRQMQFDNLLIYSNYNIGEVSFDYCCHPKRGDQVVAFKEGNKAIVHHQLCDKAGEKIRECDKMLFVEWVKDNLIKYKVVANLENKKGVLASFLHFLATKDINVLSIELGEGEEGFTSYCELQLESEIKEVKALKQLISNKYKIIEVYALKDAYNS